MKKNRKIIPMSIINEHFKDNLNEEIKKILITAADDYENELNENPSLDYIIAPDFIYESLMEKIKKLERDNNEI